MTAHAAAPAEQRPARDHLGLWFIGLSSHMMALISTECEGRRTSTMHLLSAPTACSRLPAAAITSAWLCWIPQSLRVRAQACVGSGGKTPTDIVESRPCVCSGGGIDGGGGGGSGGGGSGGPGEEVAQRQARTIRPLCHVHRALEPQMRGLDTIPAEVELNSCQVVEAAGQVKIVVGGLSGACVLLAHVEGLRAVPWVLAA